MILHLTQNFCPIVICSTMKVDLKNDFLRKWMNNYSIIDEAAAVWNT